MTYSACQINIQKGYLRLSSGFAPPQDAAQEIDWESGMEGERRERKGRARGKNEGRKERVKNTNKEGKKQRI